MNIKKITPRLNYIIDWKVLCQSVNGLFSHNFKSKLLKFYPNKQFYFFNHARTGLQFILENFKTKLKVGVQPLTCKTVLDAIQNAGHQIVFVDINDDLVIDLADLSRKKNNIDVLIVTHTFGYPVDTSEIKKVFDNKIVIEDCAHSFLSKLNGQLTGQFGDFSIFSFGSGKFPNALEGGFVIDNTNNYDLRKHYEQIPNLPFLKIIKSIILSLLNHFLHVPSIFGLVTYNLKRRRKYMSEKNHSLLVYKTNPLYLHYFNSLLENAESFVEIQRKNGSKIQNSILSNEKFIFIQNSVEKNCFLFPVLTKTPDHFIDYALQYGFEVGKHFVSLRSEIYSYGYVNLSCPNYERIVNQLITIPSHYNFKEKSLNELCKLIEKY